MLSDLPMPLELMIITVLGLLFGSFATALTYRIPRNIPWAFNRKKSKEVSAYFSACTRCQHRLGLFDLIPVISWALSAGKCRHCSAKIGIEYPLIELGVLYACLISYTALGFSAPLFWMLLATPFLAALLVIDLKFMILPNQLVIIVGVLGLCLHAHQWYLKALPAQSFLMDYGLGALVYGGSVWALSLVMSKILKKEALGFGDVKFFAVAGFWLGLDVLPYFFLASGLFGIILALLWKKIKKTPVFPFGPALIVSFFVLFWLNSSHWLEFIVK